VIDPEVRVQFIDRAKISASSISASAWADHWRATVLVVLSGLEDGGAHIFVGLELDAEAEDLMFTDEDVILAGFL
jgi:hypothetical protein